MHMTVWIKRIHLSLHLLRFLLQVVNTLLFALINGYFLKGHCLLSIKKNHNQSLWQPENKIPWLFTDFNEEFRISLTWCKIPWLFPDLEKKKFFPDFSPTVATLNCLAPMPTSVYQSCIPCFIQLLSHTELCSPKNLGRHAYWPVIKVNETRKTAWERMTRWLSEAAAVNTTKHQPHRAGLINHLSPKSDQRQTSLPYGEIGRQSPFNSPNTVHTFCSGQVGRIKVRIFGA